MNGFKITKQGDIVEKIYKYRDNYHKKGMFLGWEQLHKHYSMTLGNCTDWTGYPMSGKTQVLMELLVNTSKFYGWKHLIYFPDVGNSVEIVADLIHKKTGKSFNPNSDNVITDIEITRSMEWVMRHFHIVTRSDTKGKLSPKDFWEWAIELTKTDEGLHTASIDSWKDMHHDYEKHGGYAQYLEYILPLRNHIAEEHNLHLHTIIHPKLTEKENGKRPAPSPYDLKGGSEWFNSGKSMITVHREDILSNEVKIYFNKIKPRSIGEVGSIKMYFDKERLTYYFQDVENNNYTKYYASEQRNMISNQFPTKIPKHEPDIVNGKELLSFSEKMKNKNNENTFLIMKTVNSLSGGKTSSYIAANYPADYNVFSLVRTNDKNCLFPDSKIRQIVSDKIGKEFIGTLEEDTIIYTMLDLEQFIGSQIVWLSENTFEDVIGSYKMSNGKNYLPNQMTRFCTTDMKVKPIAQWCYENTELPVEMRIGFRANEMSRVKTMEERAVNGIESFKFKIGEKNGRNKWKELPYRKAEFPLIKDAIFKDTIENYWKDKPVRFAYQNNCVGCFHRSELMLKHMSNKAEKQFNWFIKMEQKNGCTFKKGITYEKIKSYKTQLQLFDEDFNECDLGYCGL